MNGDVVPAGGRCLPHGYPESIVQRALMYCMESQSVAAGHRRLKAELEGWGLTPIPDTHSVWEWVKQSEECLSAVTRADKREMIALTSDAARAWALRAVEAAEARHEDGSYVVLHRESAYHHGIAMQRRTDWDKVGQAGPTVAVQFNLRTRED